MLSKIKSFSFSNLLWDAWCVVSILGIWPRFIEPKLCDRVRFNLTLPQLNQKLKIAFFSDLHWNSSLSKTLLDKLVAAVNEFDPDLIFLGGDFICEGELFDPEGLIEFLNRFSSRKGMYAVLGNHDYDVPLSSNETGDYDVSTKGTPFLKAFKRLFKEFKLTGNVTDRALKVKPHKELLALLKKTSFTLLDNTCCQIGGINVVGLGEYMGGKALPEQAFQNYNKNIPGFILAHNPDMIPKLSDYPGDFFFSGHTHGGQINVPWIWKKLTLMEDLRFKGGFVTDEGKKGYVSRGIGSVLPFRFRARPEVLLMTVNHEA